MREINTLDMGHLEWLEARRTGIGGSDVGSILGFNKYKSPYQVWLDKTGQWKEEQTDNEPAYWGNVLEEVVAREFTERTGKKVRRMNKMYRHREHPFLQANIDRDVVGEPAILECKTANTFLADQWEGDSIPEQYIFQVQHYMNVLNRDYAYIAVLIGGQKFIWKRIERDQELIQLIQERLVEFWEVNVKQMIPPSIDGSDATTAFMKERYASSEVGKEILLGQAEDELIASLKEQKDIKKIIEINISQIENQLKDKLGQSHAEVAITPSNLITWKPVVSNRIDTKKLKAEQPTIYEKYRRTSTSRRFSIKEIK
ncbi:YqaJ viral recombinase family protein [Jeotgalibaca dankookensis]|uniref:YqaJ viral recombinase family nuclease n=1 Tax=Jeotgalibaca dankookensis TaxID=708126 RepID=UPI0007842408|nr:YqaJ viral recombinase family protein [Jeotgalibaca dankookensis]